MPYEGFENAEELSTQDIRRVVLKAFRRDNAWSQPSAIPVAVETHKALRGFYTLDWLKVVTSDLIAVFNGWRLGFIRLSDFSFVDVYKFPKGHEPPGFLEGEYDHGENTYVLFAPARKHQ